jgi:hypothetical protein
VIDGLQKSARIVKANVNYGRILAHLALLLFLGDSLFRSGGISFIVNFYRCAKTGQPPLDQLLMRPK